MAALKESVTYFVISQGQDDCDQDDVVFLTYSGGDASSTDSQDSLEPPTLVAPAKDST